MKRYACKGSHKHAREIGMCEECFQKQLKIDKLKEEVEHLRRQLRYRTKKDNQPYFGSSTPSSKLKFKKNSEDINKNKKGGAPPGHKGNGRKLWNESEADEVVDLKIKEKKCPNCGGQLESKGIDYRSVLDAVLVEAKKVLYRSQVKICCDCNKQLVQTPLILPKFKYGNNLIANAVIMHYLEGIPIKRIAQIFGNGVSASGLIKIFHFLANKFENVYENLKRDYRKEKIKHADETSWRIDGENGYSWLFNSNDISIFRFEKTRSSQIVRDTLGEEKLPGVLVVDRYAGYNKVSCKIQYCYAHLLRSLEDIEKKFPKNEEVKRFVQDFAKLLSSAMKLRRQKITDKEYYKKAQELKAKILALARAPAKHSAIHKYQDIFIDNENRLFHWVDNQNVPADNNKAERELRPTVIARKVSFGSQSAKGAKTRSILMSVLHSASKRLENKTIKQWFVLALEKLADAPCANLYKCLKRET
jgi:hypothetical protein